MDGTDAGDAVEDALLDSDVVTEPVNAIPTVRTDTVDLMDAEDNAEPVKETTLSASPKQIHSHSNVPSNARSLSE